MVCSGDIDASAKRSGAGILDQSSRRSASSTSKASDGTERSSDSSELARAAADHFHAYELALGEAVLDNNPEVVAYAERDLPVDDGVAVYHSYSRRLH